MTKEYKLNTINICDLLLLVFIYLKLTNQVQWDWWIVMSPIVGSFIISVLKTIWLGMVKANNVKKHNLDISDVNQQ